MKISALILLLCLLSPAPVVAQSNDAAAERARIANERIQAEADRRAEQEERRRQAEAQRAAAEAPTELPQARQVVREDPPVATTRQEPPRPPAGNAADRSLALEQLRTLGELKDAGYLTDEEFMRIKKRILEARF